MEDEPYEVTTFRIDGDYSDNRRPDTVSFTTSIKDDLSRRDFTINAIAYNPKIGIIDPFDGVSDIKSKIIRCVGDPNSRFNEDALRMLRALRFSSVLNFAIDRCTSDSIHQNKLLLENISAEHIRVELCKLLLGENAEYILTNYGDVIGVFIPEICPMTGFAQNNPYHYLDVWRHTVQAIIHAKTDETVRLTMLFHDMGKPRTYREDEGGIGHFYGHPRKSTDMCFDIMKRLRFDNDTIDTVKTLVLYHDTLIEPRNKSLKRWLNKIGEERLHLLLDVKRADVSGQAEGVRDSRLQTIDRIEACMNEILEQQQCFSMKDLQINGRDLIAMGAKPGVIIGKILRHLLEMVMDEQMDNTHEALVNEAEHFWRKQKNEL